MNPGLSGVSAELQVLVAALLSFHRDGQVTAPPGAELYSGCRGVFLSAPTGSVSEAGQEVLLNSGIFDLPCSINWWCETCFALN